MKRLKKAIALTLAFTMCVQIGACGKKDEAKKKELQKYAATVEQIIDHSLFEPSIFGNKMYSTYEEYQDDSDKSITGIISYDFETKELKENVIETGEGEYSSVNGVYETADGIVAEVEVCESNDDESYTYHIEKKYLNENLELIEQEIGESTTAKNNEEEYEYVMKAVHSNGIRYDIVDINGEYFIRKYAEDGTVETKFAISDMAEDIVALSDGTILVLVWEEDGYKLRKADFENGSLDEVVLDLSKYQVYMMSPGRNDELLITSDTTLYKCSVKDKKVEAILNFIDCDIDPDNLVGIYEYESGEYGAVVVDEYNGKSEIDRLSVVKEGDSSKKEITLGVLYLDYDLKEKVIQYNKTNPETRIKIVEYMDDETEDYDEVMKKFNADIASGNCPDMIDFNTTGIPLERYASKGLLEDLTPYFEKDAEINLEDMVESFVNVYKTGDKLYALPKALCIEGIVGPTDVVGEGYSWNIGDFMEVAESLDENVSLFDYCSREQILYMLCISDFGNYVDWESGECNFDTEDFIKILELSAKFPKAEDLWDDTSEEDGEDFEGEISKIRNGKVLLREMYLCRVEDYMESKAVYGKDITFKGFPTSEGNGIKATSAAPMIAISSKSENKDLAWEFIRQMYTAQYTSEEEEYYDVAGFPIRKDDLDKYIAFSLEPRFYIDDNGEEVEYLETFEADGIEVEIPRATKEDEAKVRDILNSVDSVMYVDEEIIYNIVMEEMESYYSGEKSAAEVADVIQSRVSIYVKENK